jgi:hypothetical protein
VYDEIVSPGGHLLTTLAACSASAFLSRDLPLQDSLALAGGIAAGGFLIDVDHAIDYLLFERQRDLRPSAFLRHYLEGRVKRAVLVLHSYELFAVLGLLAWYLDALALWGYLMGALMHLALDVVYNGQLTPRSLAAFYSFTYRLAHRFDAAALSGSRARFTTSERFWAAFFAGARISEGGSANRPSEGATPPRTPRPTFVARLRLAPHCLPPGQDCAGKAGARTPLNRADS